MRRFLTVLMSSVAILDLYTVALAQEAPAAAPPPALAPANKPHNVIIFVADGLRSGIVTDATAPTLARIRREGVDFHNSHSVYPTVTTVNASAIATGHRPGDTGEFANNMLLGQIGMKSTYGAPVGDMEDDGVLIEYNGLMGGNYLRELSFLSLARAHGYQTAAIGKEGPVLIQDIAASASGETLFVDDESGHTQDKSLGGLSHPKLPEDIQKAILTAGLDKGAPARGLNGSPGAYNLPGVIVANTEQQDWFVGVATKVVLPKFKADGRPFAMVYWSRDPDGTQHNQGDSLNKLTPGINGPTSLAAIRNASDNLEALIEALKAQGLYDTTDIFVTADHGFATVSRQSKTSAAAKMAFPEDTVKGFLPTGFMAIDLANTFKTKIFDVSGLEVPLHDKKFPQHPKGAQILGSDPKAPLMTIIGGGGSDVIYLDPARAATLAPKIIAALTAQDYVGALFVSDDLGNIPGALKFSDIGLIGSAKTPRPAIYVSFRSTSTGCANPELCTVINNDSGLQQGQGSHGSLSRAETHNFMAAQGPDFKSGFIDPSPVSNADIAPTLAHILGFDLKPVGSLNGRVIAESLKDGQASVPTEAIVKRSQPAANGFVTVLEAQSAEGETYLDAAGKPGRVVGLKTQK